MSTKKKGLGLSVQKPPADDGGLDNFIKNGLSSAEPPREEAPAQHKVEEKQGVAKEPSRKQRSIYLNDDLMIRAGIYRLKQGVTMTKLVEQALEKYLDENGG
jgi:hypothetical protein